MMEQPNDIILLTQAGSGDQKSFELLYNKYWHQLYVSANKVLRDDVVSEDIVQEIFTTLWKKAPHVQIENLNAYLYQSVKFQVAKKLRELDNYKTYLKEINYIIQEKHPQVIDKLHYSELMQKVNMLVADLPKKCREIFIQSRFYHLSNAEIATTHSISVKTVENQLNKALKYLRANMDDASLSLILPICVELYTSFQS